MSQIQPDRPTELAIDIDQWKRDIKTFVDTTKQALHAIAAELSYECSNGYESSFGSGPSHESLRPIKNDPNDAQESVRLAQLKSQLSQRISKTD